MDRQPGLTYRVINLLLHFAHVLLILFSVLAWILPSTRVAHLWVQGLVGISWFVFGAWKGWGFCLLTDLQWRWKRLHGVIPETSSFVEYWTHTRLGLSVPARWVENAILWTWLTTTLASGALCLRG